MQLKNLNSSQFSRLSALLDQAIEMPPDAREGWLMQIERADPESADLLRRLLSSNNGAADGWLETGELVPQQVTSPTEPAMMGTRFGPYRVVSLLGHGGMGSV